MNLVEELSNHKDEVVSANREGALHYVYTKAGRIYTYYHGSWKRVV